VKMVGFDCSSYAFLFNEELCIVGMQHTKKLWPHSVNEIIKDSALLRLNEDKIPADRIADGRKLLLRRGYDSILQARAEELVAQTVVSREHETLTDVDREDTKIRKAASKAFDRLCKEGVIGTPPPALREQGIYMAFILQNEDKTGAKGRERKEFVSPHTRVRLIFDPYADVEKADRDYCFFKLTRKPVKRMLGIDVYKLFGRPVKTDGEDDEEQEEPEEEPEEEPKNHKLSDF